MVVLLMFAGVDIEFSIATRVTFHSPDVPALGAKLALQVAPASTIVSIQVKGSSYLEFCLATLFMGP